MAAITGTLVESPNLGLPGRREPVLAKFTFAAALATTDTYSISDLFPKPVKIHSVRVIGDIMDTNATPTLDIAIGNSDDADGFLKDIVITQTGQTNIVGFDGALIKSVISNPDITMTVNADPATGATSGTWYLEFDAERVNYSG